MEKTKTLIKPPTGLDGINSTFGNLADYVTIRPDGSMTLNPEFERKYIANAKLPFPIPLAWDRSMLISEFRCHRLLREHFEDIFIRILKAGLKDKVQSFGGCFQYRKKRVGKGLSTHSWGIAIDLNPLTNRQGTAGDMDSEVIQIFKTVGFIWGGDWSGHKGDPMHFQFCSGY